jgi:hypothetical protein
VAKVFTDDAYVAVASNFRRLAAASQSDGRPLMEKKYGNYDALMLSVDHQLVDTFHEFFGEQQLRFLAALLGIPFVPRIVGALHSSPPHSRTGWIHTDYCVVWFDENSPSLGPLSFPSSNTCDYFTGRVKSKSARPVAYARVATLIFYLCNDGWAPQNGGQTVLYSSMQGDGACESISPLNNTLLFFECSPHSYHRFITNPSRTRNSIILWLHLPVQEAESRWGPPNRHSL